MGFLRKIMGKLVRQIVGGTWETPRAEVVQEAAGTHLLMTYIGKIQENVAQWVALKLIFEVCAGEKGYKGCGFRS